MLRSICPLGWALYINNNMKLPHQPKAVIFDMDGLLIDTVPLYVKSMIQASVDVGCSLTPEYILSLAGLLGDQLEKQLTHDQGVQFPIVPFFEAMSTRLEPLLTKGVSLKPGARELIEKLSEAEMPLAVATSMKKDAAKYQLDNHDLTKFFRCVIGRDDVVNSKPHPDIHLKAASGLGIHPEFCVVLEDSFNGVIAAHAAGTMPIMIPDILQPSQEIERLCACIISSLYQAEKTLLGLENV